MVVARDTTTEHFLESLPLPIAVVGNGPIKDYGNKIDAHASIIRLNNFISEGFEEHVGSLISAWCTNCWWDVPYRNLGVPPFTVFNEKEDGGRVLLWASAMGAPKLILPRIRWDRQIRRRFNINKPSTGLLLLYALDTLDIPADAYGFDGMQGGHYWDPTYLHDHGMEVESLRKFDGIHFYPHPEVTTGGNNMLVGGIEGMWLFMLQKIQPRPKSILDIGCRDLRSSEHIIKWFPPFGYCGVDVRADWLNAGQEKNPQAILRVVEENDFGRSFHRRFDVVMASCVVYHLRDDLVEELFKAIPGLLHTGGRALMNVNIKVIEGMWEGLPFVKRTINFYRDLATKAGLLLADLGPISRLGYPAGVDASDNHMLELTVDPSHYVPQTSYSAA